MGMDIRAPIGWLFTIIGVLLVTWGVSVSSYNFEPIGPQLDVQHSTTEAVAAFQNGPSTLDARQGVSVNVDLVWGLVLLLFGMFMLFMCARSEAWHLRMGPQLPPKVG